MKAIFSLVIAFSAAAFAEEALVAIPMTEGTDPAAVAAQLAAIAAASTGTSVTVEDVQTGTKVEAKIDEKPKAQANGEWLTWNFKFETGNHVIQKGSPLSGNEWILPGLMAFSYFGGEASVKEWVNVAGYMGGPGLGASVEVQPFKFFAPRAPIHDYKFQPTVSYRWFHYKQLGTSASREAGQLYKRKSNGLAWGLNYALTKSTKIYVQAGKQDWNEEYFVQISPWVNGPAETRFEKKKRGTVFVGVSVKIP
jgi:hypothetical protein